MVANKVGVMVQCRCVHWSVCQPGHPPAIWGSRTAFSEMLELRITKVSRFSPELEHPCCSSVLEHPFPWRD